MGRYVLGLDGGTGGMRAFVFDANGTPITSASQTYETSYPQPGRAEQQPEQWLQAVTGSIRQAVRSLDVDELAGLCAATTSCTVVCCTETGEHLAPAILWMDVRADEQMRKIKQLTGQSISAETFLCKALWLKENEPQLWAKTQVLCEYQDYLNHWLTGEWCFSANTACNWGYNNRKKAFDVDFLRTVGLEDLPDKIPARAVCAGAPIAPLCAGAAAALGLPPGIPVVQGGIDSSIGMLGMGTVRPGDLSLMTGSSNLAMAVTEQPLFTPPEAVNSGPDFLLPGYYTSVQGQAATGSILRWFRREFCRDLGMDCLPLLDRAATAVPPGSNGLLVLDYWQGNRCPYNDPNAAGTIVGLTMNTSREQIYRAVLEGVAYGTLDVLNTFSDHGHPVERVHISGGFTRSPVFMQIYADVCGIPFLVTSDYSVALGSAILTAYALGWYPSIPAAADSMVHHQTTVYPDAQTHQLYLRQFQRYQRLYRALKNEQIF